VRCLTTALDDFEAQQQYVNPVKTISHINSEEEFFLQQLKDLGILDVQPKFTSQGIEFNALSCLDNYYEPKEMVRLLESLTEKGFMEKINYGTVALCPECLSPVFMLTLACPRCGSLKVSKKELVKHIGCGYSGPSDKFVVGIHYVCPSCGAQAKIGEAISKGQEQFKVSDSLYECEDCGSVSANALTSFNCIKCKTKFTAKEIRYENPCGYRIVEAKPIVLKPVEVAALEPEEEPPDELVEEPAEEVKVDDPKPEPEPEPEPYTVTLDLEQIKKLNDLIEPKKLSETRKTEKSIEVEPLSHAGPKLPPELELEPEPEPESEPEPELKPEPKLESKPKPRKAPPVEEAITQNIERKPGLLGRILPRREASQPKPLKPLKVEKEVMTRSEARILLIEEHQYRADRILKALEKTRLQSIEVRHASSGKLGLRELRQPYDAVILDMNLTDVDPDLIVKEISRWKVTTPLIVVNDVDTSATIIGRVDLAEVKELEYSEAAVRQLPDILEKMLK